MQPLPLRLSKPQRRGCTDFGNPDPEGTSYTPRDANGVALTGPYKGTDFSGGRFQYWLPKDEDPVPLDQVAEEVRAGLPDWVHAVVSHDNSPEPGALCASSLKLGGLRRRGART